MTANGILDVIGSGIYAIRCFANNKVYVGSAYDLPKRRRTHWRELSRGTHANKNLQSSWNKYGKDAFSFEVICFGDKSELLKLEQHYIDEYRSAEVGFNLAKYAASPMRDRHHSEDARSRIGMSRAGTKLSSETRSVMKAAAIKNRHVTSRNTANMWAARSEADKSDLVRKITAKTTGKKRSPEVVEKLREIALQVWQTDEHKEKMLKAQSNRRAPVYTDQAKRLHQEKVKAYQNSPAAKAVQLAVHLGRKCSEETKQKMSASAKEREARKKLAQI